MKRPLKKASLYTLILTLALSTLPWFAWRDEIVISGLTAFLTPFGLAGLLIVLLGWLLRKKRPGTCLSITGLVLLLTAESYTALLWYVSVTDEVFSLHLAVSCLRPLFYVGVILTLLSLALALPVWPVRPLKQPVASNEEHRGSN